MALRARVRRTTRGEGIDEVVPRRRAAPSPECLRAEATDSDPRPSTRRASADPPAIQKKQPGSVAAVGTGRHGRGAPADHRRTSQLRRESSGRLGATDGHLPRGNSPLTARVRTRGGAGPYSDLVPACRGYRPVFGKPDAKHVPVTIPKFNFSAFNTYARDRESVEHIPNADLPSAPCRYQDGTRGAVAADDADQPGTECRFGWLTTRPGTLRRVRDRAGSPRRCGPGCRGLLGRHRRRRHDAHRNGGRRVGRWRLRRRVGAEAGRQHGQAAQSAR